MMLFISLRDIRAASTDRRVTVKLCHMLDNTSQNSGPPQKNLRPKHAKFSGLYTTLDFDRENLRNESRYPKSEVIENNSSRVRRKRSGEVWCTIQKVIHVSLNPANGLFQETTV